MTPAYIAPRYASALAGFTPQMMRTRSPGCSPAEEKRAAKPTMCAARSAAAIDWPVAASTRDEPSPSRSKSRAAKLVLGELCIFQSAEFGLHDSADFFHIFHFHQVVDIEREPKFLLQAACQTHMA